MCTDIVCMYTNEECKVYTFNILLHNIMYNRCVSTSMSVQRVMQESTQLAEVVNRASHLTSSIAHLLKIAPPPGFSHEPYPPLASQNNVIVLNELKCVVCSNILSRSLELPCRKLVCTRCVVERVAASTTVCPCCSADGSLVPREIRPASNVTLLLQKDVLVQFYGMPQRCEGWLL